MKKTHEPLLVKEFLKGVYDSMEFTLASGITNYDVRANVTGAYENYELYTTINIRTTEDITIKLNSTDNRDITIYDNRPFELDNMLEIKNIYISNASGSTASIKIIGIRKGAIQ